MSDTDGFAGHPLVRILRAAATLALGVAIGLAVLATLAERTVFEVGALRLRTLHLTDAWSALSGAVLLRWLLSAGALRALAGVRRQAAARLPGRGARVFLALLLLNLLLLPHSLGHGVAQSIKAARAERDPATAMPPAFGAWKSTNIDPIIVRARREIPERERVLLLGPGLREFERYLIAYAIFPRRVFMHPADEERLTLRHTPFARPRRPRLAAPTDADHVDWARERAIRWVIFRDGDDPTETRILRLEKAFPP